MLTIRRGILFLMLSLLISAVCFGQAGVLRDYVGLIRIHYHPDVIALMTRSRDNWEKSGHSDVAKSIDNYLEGLSGSGFAYVAPDGTCYILTNEHVVAQSDSLSITFEKQDGAKTTYDRLRVLVVDEEKDLALLVFDGGIRPFTDGLSFSTTAVDEGGDIYAAGFPGLGNTAIWQFSRGIVSNAAVRLPKSSDSDETFGPFIQHTAQIDPGNSGGPLLVAAEGVPSGYAVTGINTLSARWRQGANYAIPVDQINAFITAALSTEPVNERELIAKRVDDFLKGLRVNRAVYSHIAGFLSNDCTASNAEWAITELLDRGSRAAVSDIDDIFSNDPVEGMGAAVGWIIENSMRSRSGSISINLDSITPNDRGGFYVTFDVNGTSVRSEWIKEYGVYRLNVYGDIATGDKTRIADNERKRELERGLRTDYALSISAGYAHILGDYGPAFHAALRFGSETTAGVDAFFGLDTDKEYLHIGISLGFAFPIRLNTFAITPFGELGGGIFSTAASKARSDVDRMEFPFSVGFTLKGGLMVTFAQVPGLFGRVFYEHAIIPEIRPGKANIIGTHGIIGVSIGYGF